MISISLLINNKEIKIPFPESYNELSNSELEFVVAAQQEEYSIPVIFCKLIANSAKQNKIRLPKRWENKLNFDEAAVVALDALKFLSVNDLTNFPFKKLLVAGEIMLGCNDRFKNFTCRQMEMAFPKLLLFRENHSVVHLQEMVAALFHFPGEVAADQDCIEKVLNYVKSIHLNKLMCCYYWFSGCIQLLPQYFPELYEGSAGDEESYTVFTSLIHAGAGARNGSRQSIRDMELLEFLYDMWLQKKEAKKLENANK